MQVRLATPADLETITQFCAALWPAEPAIDHRAHVAAILAGEPHSTLPLVLLVAQSEGGVVGFLEVGLRSHADGCDGRYPVGYIEGWYVEPAWQHRGVGRALMEAAEDWARGLGARETASDTWIDHEASQRAHAAMGFEVVDRVVTYRKSIVDD